METRNEIRKDNLEKIWANRVRSTTARRFKATVLDFIIGLAAIAAVLAGLFVLMQPWK